MKTAELTGAALDWAVAKCEEEYIGTPEIIRDADGIRLGFVVPDGYIEGLGDVVKVEEYSPSTDWSQGGPIIEREKIALIPPNDRIDVWEAVHPNQMHDEQYGETALIAAMRCYVASKLGDEIEIPEELK